MKLKLKLLNSAEFVCNLLAPPKYSNPYKTKKCLVEDG